MEIEGKKKITQRCSPEGPGREIAAPFLLFYMATETFLLLFCMPHT